MPIIITDTSTNANVVPKAINTALLGSSHISIGRAHKKQPDWFVALDRKDSSLSRTHVKIDATAWNIQDVSKYGSDLNNEKMTAKEWMGLMDGANQVHLGVHDTNVEVKRVPLNLMVLKGKARKSALVSVEMVRDTLQGIFADSVVVENVNDVDSRMAERVHFSHLVVENAADLDVPQLLKALLLGARVVSSAWYMRIAENDSQHIFDWPQEERYTVPFPKTRWSKVSSLKKLSWEPNEEQRQMLQDMTFVLLSQDTTLQQALQLGGAKVVYAKPVVDELFFEQIKKATVIVTNATPSDMIKVYEELGFDIFTTDDLLKAFLSASKNDLLPTTTPIFVSHPRKMDNEPETAEVEKEASPVKPKEATSTKKRNTISFSSSEDEDTVTEQKPAKNSRKRKRSPDPSPKSSNGTAKLSEPSPKRARAQGQDNEEKTKSPTPRKTEHIPVHTSALEIEYSDLTQDEDADMKEELYYDSLENSQRNSSGGFNAKRFRKALPRSASQQVDKQDEAMIDVHVVDLEPFDDFGVKTEPCNDGSKASAIVQDDESSDDDDLMAAVAKSEKDQSKKKRSTRKK